MHLKQTATVVIGSAWGDEGKGLFSDFLAHNAPKNEKIIIRFNGGAQAGHTVVTPDGRRHVFSHFGSGAFTGTPTFLAEDFILNPMLFMKEKNRLLQLGIEDKDLVVYVDPRAVISTPYDMLINQIAERHRGNTRHGSVGIGIGETVERSISPKLRIVHGDMNIKTTNDTFQKLKRIRTEWVQQRLQILGINGPNEKTQTLFNQIQNDEIIERWMEDYHNYHASTIGMEVALVLKTRSKTNGSVIFEGAQGLLLDQNHTYFPYVTRSNTGLTNVVKIAQEIGIEHLDVYYLHRAYATRHGAGPFPHESNEKPYQNIFDHTNKKAEFQGSLRFGLPDLDLITSTISDDFLKNSSMSLTPHLGITCFDQIDEFVSYYHDNKENMTSHEGFIHILEKLFIDKSHKNLGDTFVSYGPTRNDIKIS